MILLGTNIPDLFFGKHGLLQSTGLPRQAPLHRGLQRALRPLKGAAPPRGASGTSEVGAGEYGEYVCWWVKWDGFGKIHQRNP